jgi:hypothetical protein
MRNFGNAVPADIFSQKSRQEVVKDEVLISPPVSQEAAFLSAVERLIIQPGQEHADSAGKPAKTK